MKKGQKTSFIGLKNMRIAVKNRNYTIDTISHMRKVHLGNKNSLGVKHSKEENEKNRIRNTGSGNAMYGKKQSEKTKQLIREKANGRKRTPDSIIKQREWNIQHPNRKFKDTSIELKIEEELKKRNINYQKQIPLCKVAIVDFYLPEYKIIIQADGDYWHNLPKQKEKDKRQDSILSFNGFNVYRFWEHEINKSVSNCIDSILWNI